MQQDSREEECRGTALPPAWARALAGGRALPASQLARIAGMSQATAQASLLALQTSGHLQAVRSGGHDYWRTTRTTHAPSEPLPTQHLSRKQRELRAARSCYGHLAGRLGVAVAQRLLALQLLETGAPDQWSCTPAGQRWFMLLGVDAERLRPGKRGRAWPCLDWTEREPHLGGPLGKGLLQALCRRGWAQRVDGSRALVLSAAGREGLCRELQIPASILQAAAVHPGETGGTVRA